MNRMSSVFSYLLRTRVQSSLAIAAVFSGLVLVALGQYREDQPNAATAPAAAPRIVVAEAPEAQGARSYSYYPEQLAALRSMSSFTPIADAGLKPEVVPAVTTVKDAPPPPRIGRRADASVKVGAPGQPTHAAADAGPGPSAQEPPGPKTKIFGMALPGLPDFGQSVKGAREAATRWGKAAAGLGDRIAGLWR